MRDNQNISVTAGTIYCRNKRGRVQSSRVSNSYDMRDIITIATAKMMRRLTTMGLSSSQTEDEAARIKEKLKCMAIGELIFNH